jgi:hypothetical protein
MIKVEVTNPNKKSDISIRPFTGIEDEMGLHRYDLVVFDGVVNEEWIACLEQNGVRRYVTGLNEFAPEVQRLDEEAKKATIKDIRKTVAYLEKALITNVISEDDSDFWGKVKILKPDNDEFWSKVSIRCGNDPVFLDQKDPYDLIKYYAIKAGGFSTIAADYNSAKESNMKGVRKRFFLDRFEDTLSVKVEASKFRNKALGELHKLYEKNTEKMLLVTKILDANSLSYRSNTPPDVLYQQLDRYIQGVGIDKDKIKAPQKFLALIQTPPEELKIRAIIKDAAGLNLLRSKSDGLIYYEKTQTAVGRTPQDVFVFLKNPLHQDILVDLQKEVESNWSR